MKNHFLLFAFVVSFFSVSTFAQNAQTQIEVVGDKVNISATKDINLNTGNGKVLYNGDEVATNSDVQRAVTIVIAASNASEKSKAGADYVCTGTNDNLVINRAIQSLPEYGGVIQLTEGDFIFNNSVWEYPKDITIQGCGRSTVLHRGFTCDWDNGGLADSMLRAHSRKKTHYKDFTIDSGNMVTEGNKNNSDILCWNGDPGIMEGWCVIENVDVINGMIHQSQLRTVAFSLSGINSRIINCNIDVPQCTDAIWIYPERAVGVTTIISNCNTNSPITVETHKAVISNNIASNMDIKSFNGATATLTNNTVSGTMYLRGTNILSTGNICGSIVNNATNSLVTNNLILK